MTTLLEAQAPRRISTTCRHLASRTQPARGPGAVERAQRVAWRCCQLLNLSVDWEFSWRGRIRTFNPLIQSLLLESGPASRGLSVRRASVGRRIEVSQTPIPKTERSLLPYLGDSNSIAGGPSAQPV